jgi:hypothetical protein
MIAFSDNSMVRKLRVSKALSDNYITIDALNAVGT